MSWWRASRIQSLCTSLRMHERSQLSHFAFLNPVAKSEDKNRWGKVSPWPWGGAGNLPSLCSLGLFFSSITTSLSVPWMPPHVWASAPGLGQCRHSDVCTMECGVSTQRDLGGWWGLHHHVARPLDLRVRSKNSGRELKEKILHQCYVLTTGVEFWNKILVAQKIGVLCKAGLWDFGDTVGNCQMSLPWY